MTMEPKTIESGGVNDRQIHLIGPVKFAQLTLKRGMTSNLQLWQWLALTARGTVAPASGTVTMWDADATPVVEFALDGCLPVRMRAPSLNAKEGLVAVEELALVYETMSVRPAGSGGLWASAAGSASARRPGFPPASRRGFPRARRPVFPRARPPGSPGCVRRDLRGCVGGLSVSGGSRRDQSSAAWSRHRQDHRVESRRSGRRGAGFARGST